MFQVNYWPESGHITLTHTTPGMQPVVTTLDVRSVQGAALPDVTFSIAHALAKVADPAGDLIRHEELRVVRQDLNTLAETEI